MRAGDLHRADLGNIVSISAGFSDLQVRVCEVPVCGVWGRGRVGLGITLRKSCLYFFFYYFVFIGISRAKLLQKFFVELKIVLLA